MRPLMYSEKSAEISGIGWTREGRNICYYKNQYPQRDTTGKTQKSYATLSFCVQFEHDNDICYFAPCYPYTASDLKRYLQSLEDDVTNKDKLKRSVLCTTLAGNACDLLTITSFPVTEEQLKVIYLSKFFGFFL